MNLHKEELIFRTFVQSASLHLNVPVLFVEKDYWITLVLSNLSKSKYAEESVFKGGTSLSKAYHLIERFSEDVDIAIINDKGKTGIEIKTIIRNIEKEITSDLQELQMDGITSKGSRFRKSVYEYPPIEKRNTGNKLIVEINSFANPFPYQRLTIRSMVLDFLEQTNNENYIELYHLQSFEVSVLSMEQTLMEKIVSLIRFSFKENAIDSISEKIRHFYDLYYLMKSPECIKFVASSSFKEKFETILNHDREIFDEPIGWQNKLIIESPLVNDFSKVL